VWLAVPLALASFGLTTFLAAYPWAKWLAFAVTIPVQFVSGWPVLKGAVQQARAGSANMDTLIALGTMTAFTYSVFQLFTGGPVYFDTAALISASVVLGRYFEARAQGRRQRQSASCWRWAPRKPACSSANRKFSSPSIRSKSGIWYEYGRERRSRSTVTSSRDARLSMSRCSPASPFRLGRPWATVSPERRSTSTGY
jgi:hypothetical protein